MQHRTNRGESKQLDCWNTDGVHSNKLKLDQFLSEHGIDICLVNEMHLKCGEALSLTNFICHWIYHPSQAGSIVILVHCAGKTVYCYELTRPGVIPHAYKSGEKLITLPYEHGVMRHECCCTHSMTVKQYNTIFLFMIL